MNLWFRLIYQLLSARWRTPLKVLELSVTQFRCWPTDLDVNLHMNNGRYLTLMDLGRMDLVLRSGLLKTMLRRRWRPVVASLEIRYRRPLLPGQKFRLETRILGWEGKWFYLEQRFMLGETLAAEAQVKALLLGPQGSVPVEEALQAVGQAQPSPSLEGVHTR